MDIFSILLPVFAIVVIGFLYARRFAPDMGSVNALVLNVFLPALVLDVLSSGDFQVLTYRWLALGALVVIAASGLLSWPVGRWLGYPQRAFLPTMMFNNCGNLGLPVAVLAFGEPALEAALVLFLVSNVAHFTLGVALFGGHISLRGMLLNPVNLATVLALAINFSGTTIPANIALPLEMLGQIVIPMMLFSLGVRLARTPMSHARSGLVAGLVCPLSGLAGGIFAAWLLPLDPYQAGILVLFSAMPPAVLNFLFAEQYGQHPEMVASMVLIGNAMSVVILTLVLWLYFPG